MVPRLLKTRNTWDEALFRSLYPPLIVFVWLIVISIILPIIMREFKMDVTYIRDIVKIRELGFVLLLLWFSIRFIRYMESAIVKRPKETRKIDDASLRAITQLLRVLVIVLAILISMQTLGISIGTLLAFGGVGGLAIGFCGQGYPSQYDRWIDGLLG